MADDQESTGTTAPPSGVGAEMADLAGFAAFVAAIVAGHHAIASFGGWSAKALHAAYQRGSLWWHHQFTAKAKKALGVAGMVNAAFSLLSGIYAVALIFAIRDEIHVNVAEGVIVVWALATFALLLSIATRYRALATVKPLSQQALEDFLSTESLRVEELYTWLADQAAEDDDASMISQSHLVELMHQTGFDREHLCELLEVAIGITIDEAEFLTQIELATRTSEEQQLVLEGAFGKKGELGMGTAFLAVLSYLVNAGLILGLASWLTAAGPLWGFQLGAFPKWWHLAGLLILGIALLFIGGVVLLGTLLLADGLAKNLLAYAGALFKATWDIVLTAMPNIQGEEAKQLLPRVTFGQILPVFKTVAFSLPGKFLLGCIAFLGSFPHPFFWFVAVAAFIFIGFGGVTAEGFGNDITESMKATGRFIGFVTLLLATFHIVEFLVDVGWVGNVWEYLGNHGIFWWWNRFASVSLITYVKILALVLPATYVVTKIPVEGKWVRKVRTGLLALSGAVLVVLTLGQVAHLAGANAYIGEYHPSAHHAQPAISVTNHAHRTARVPTPSTRSVVQPRSVASTRHPSLGVAPVPPIPMASTRAQGMEVASGDLPSCDSLHARTDSYRELSRRMGRCR